MPVWILFVVPYIGLSRLKIIYNPLLNLYHLAAAAVLDAYTMQSVHDCKQLAQTALIHLNHCKFAQHQSFKFLSDLTGTENRSEVIKRIIVDDSFREGSRDGEGREGLTYSASTLTPLLRISRYATD